MQYSIPPASPAQTPIDYWHYESSTFASRITESKKGEHFTPGGILSYDGTQTMVTVATPFTYRGEHLYPGDKIQFDTETMSPRPSVNSLHLTPFQ